MPLSSHEYGPLMAPLQDLEVKVYGDRVVTEQTYHITGVRSVTTVRRSIWRLGNLFVFAFMAVSAMVLLVMASVSGHVCSFAIAMVFGVIALYTLGVFLKLESDASQRRGYR